MNAARIVAHFLRSGSRRLIDLMVSLCILLGASQGNAREFRAKFIPGTSQDTKNLHWAGDRDTLEPVIQMKTPGQSKDLYFVLIRGSVNQDSSELVFNSAPVQRDQNGNFTLEVSIKSKTTKISILSIDKEGNIVPYEAVLSVQEWPELLEYNKPLNKKTFVSANLGLASISYRQLGIPDLGETALTAGLTGEYFFTESRFEAKLDARLTLLPLTQSSARIQFMNFSLATGYSIPRKLSPWQVKVFCGYQFETLLGASGAFGFKSVGMLQLYPTVSYQFPKGQLAWIYLKFSPVLDGISPLGLSHAESALGGGYRFIMLPRGRSLALLLDFSFLKFQLGPMNVNLGQYSTGVDFQF